MSDKLDRWARQPGPERLLAEARRRLEAGHLGDRVRLDVPLDGEQRRQVGRLLGLAWQVSGDPVTLGRLRRSLAATGDDLTALLVRHGGRLRNQPEEQRAERAARSRAVADAYARLTATGVPPPVTALARARRWLGRPGVDDLNARAAAVGRLWQALPAHSRLLAELSSTLFDDPHALDRGRELGRLAARVLAAAAADPSEPGAVAAAADGALAAAAWRRTWAAYGVQCDQVSSTVLVLCLPLTGTAPAVAMTRAAAGEPVWLTARSLRGTFAPADDVCEVRVCENPAVVEAAADTLGSRCPPLVCVYGRPSGAAWTLLRAVADAGVRLLVTGDRDAPGTRIAAELLELPGAQPWLPEAAGRYEEARLAALLTDLASPPRRDVIGSR